MIFKINDNFLKVSECQAIFNTLNSRGWSYGWIANIDSHSARRHWHIDLWDSGLGSDISVLPKIRDSETVINIGELWDRLSELLPINYQPVRIYANAHTFGVEGEFHQDCAAEENDITALIYINPVWKMGWGGATHFSNLDAIDSVTTIFPKPGKLVLFSGAIPHCAQAPNRECHDLRVTLVVKAKQSALTV